MCCEEAKLANFYIATLLEGVASFLLIFIGGSVYVKYERPYPQNAIYEIAMVFGAMIVILSQCLKDISKAHINPVVSLGSLLTKRVSLLRGFSFIIFQIGGAIAGVFALNAMVPYADARGMAMTALAHDVTLIKAAIYEMLFTAVYTWIHFSSRNSRDTFKGLSGPLSLGIFYALSHIILIPYTGCSLNPARSLAPAIFKTDYNEIWVFTVAPFLSGSFTALMYDMMVDRYKVHPQPRARSCSITCCRPSREEVVINKNADLFANENRTKKTPGRSGPDFIIYPPLGDENLV